jgi:hypothetical protein
MTDSPTHINSLLTKFILGQNILKEVNLKENNVAASVRLLNK